jgi:gluconate 2-dehydrogenase gamma chain
VSAGLLDYAPGAGAAPTGALELLELLGSGEETGGVDTHVTLDRRRLLQAGLAGLIAFAAIGSGGRALAAIAPAGAVPAGTLVFIRAYADTMIPDTDTPGAVKAGAPDIVVRFLTASLKPVEFAGMMAGIDRIAAILRERGGASFDTLPVARRTELLAAFDAEILAPPKLPPPAPALATKSAQPPTPPGASKTIEAQQVPAPPQAKVPAAVDYQSSYRRLRGLVLFGYYTSEIGGSQELRYELVPGRYDADIPYDPKERAYSNAS